ncbi:BON domain-containing protein [Tepidicella xavieri]|uniref:Osmotically-inducible protein OsmY n=1 Tax=Tepidicella xavieri TaxID=360241 RepID=A0A4R6UDV9_9BURK|nr:osmotically-inducible protein OsmY [Tepidicella xavieri]
MIAMKRIGWRRVSASVLVATAAVAGLSACAPLVVGGAVGTGVLVATDRRTAGIQLEDQSIEMRAASRLREAFGNRARVSVTSYNRRVLLTGEVPSETDRALAVRIVSEVENVAEIIDELAVMSSPSLTARSSDALVTARVKAALVDARDLSANAFKVTTDRGTVYLMGRVTQREAERATEVTRSLSGVQRVVRVLEIISEEELARIQPRQAPADTAAGQR